MFNHDPLNEVGAEFWVVESLSQFHWIDECVQHIPRAHRWCCGVFAHRSKRGFNGLARFLILCFHGAIPSEAWDCPLPLGYNARSCVVVMKNPRLFCVGNASDNGAPSVQSESRKCGGNDDEGQCNAIAKDNSPDRESDE